MTDRPNQEEFIKAALDGDLEKVKALISAGVCINAIVCTAERETLLHRCIHTHIIKELVSRGARHWPNAYKEAPLNFAILRGHGIEKIRALLKSPRGCNHSPDRHWNTPLNNALLRHNTVVAMELLKLNCEIELKVKDSRYNNPWKMKCMNSLKLLIKCCIIYAVGNPHKQTYSVEDFRNTPNCRYNDLVDYGKQCKAEIEKMKNDEIGTNISLFNVVAKYPDDYFKRKSIAVRLTNRSDFEEIYPIYEDIMYDVILEPYVKRLHLFKKIDQSDIGLFPWRCIRDVLKNILEYLSNDDLENFISYACESPQCSASNLTEAVNVSDVNEEPSSSNAKRPRLTYMGKPALYYATLSPPARAVMLTAAALGVELELRPINLIKGEHLTPEFIKMNPQHTIPTLDDDGVIITDSHAICAYLVGKYGTDDKLYPKDLVKRANVDARLHLDSGHLFARLRMLYEPILYYGSTDCSIDKIAYIQKCWDILENFLKESPYLCGDELTIADFCCVATVSSVNEVAPINETKYPKLTAWLERLAELPYYKSVNEEGAEELKTLFKEKLAENKSKK